MKHFETAHVQETSPLTVEIRRTFRDPRELVFRAYTEPALLRRWMIGYPGWELTVCEMDVRANGKYRWRWRNDAEKMEFGFDGVFKTVQTPERLVQTQIFDPGTMGGDMGRECLISATFIEAEGQTTLTTEIRYQSADDMKKALETGMTDGMESSYKMLDSVLAAP